MMINMLLEEAGQYFYCEARKTAPHAFEGIVHFLHKVGDGNAFVRGKTVQLGMTFDCRDDALAAAQQHGRNVAMLAGSIPTQQEGGPCYDKAVRNVGRMAAGQMENPAC